MGTVLNFGPRPRPLPATEPSTEDLIEYREQVDRGNRVAFPMLFDGLGADPEPPPLDAEEIQLIGSELQDMRTAGIEAAKIADRPSSRHLHAQLMGIVDELDRTLSDLAGRGDAA